MVRINVTPKLCVGVGLGGYAAAEIPVTSEISESETWLVCTSKSMAMDLMREFWTSLEKLAALKPRAVTMFSEAAVYASGSAGSATVG